VETAPQQETIKILKADDVISYLTQIQTAVGLVNDYLQNLKVDLQTNIEKIQEDKTDA